MPLLLSYCKIDIASKSRPMLVFLFACEIGIFVRTSISNSTPNRNKLGSVMLVFIFAWEIEIP